jgi:predicted transcriptional regulator
MSTNKIPLHTQVAQDLYNAVEDLAKRLGVPKSYIVRAALVQYIKSAKPSDSEIDLTDLTFEE